MVAYSNCMLTYFISLTRVETVCSVTSAIRTREQTASRIVAELVIYCAFGVLSGFVCFYISMNYGDAYINLMILSYFSFVMIVSSIVIRLKVRPMNHALRPKSSVREKQGFHKLVAIVTITFLFCHIFSIIFYSLHIFEDILLRRREKSSSSMMNITPNIKW